MREMERRFAAPPPPSYAEELSELPELWDERAFLFGFGNTPLEVEEFLTGILSLDQVYVKVLMWAW